MVDAHPLDAGATVDNLASYFAAYAQTSADARERHCMRADLAYGPTQMERLDFFDAGAGAPLVAFIHGGYWRRLDKNDFSFIADGLIPHGISFVSINYALAPATPLYEIVEQCRRAIGWLYANSDMLGFDAERLSVFGHSAGGHLAAMAAIIHPVRSLVTLSGLHDLVPVQQSFANEWLCLDPDQARILSPISYAPARPCTIFATAGERESEAFKAQGQTLVKAWSAHGSDATYQDSAGDNHFTICNRLRDPADDLTRTVARLARG